jgi:hypothetical protein
MLSDLSPSCILPTLPCSHLANGPTSPPYTGSQPFCASPFRGEATLPLCALLKNRFSPIADVSRRPQSARSRPVSAMRRPDSILTDTGPDFGVHMPAATALARQRPQSATLGSFHASKTSIASSYTSSRRPQSAAADPPTHAHASPSTCVPVGENPLERRVVTSTSCTQLRAV